MDSQNGADGGYNTTNGAKRKRKLADDGNNADNHLPIKRICASLRIESSHHPHATNYPLPDENLWTEGGGGSGGVDVTFTNGSTSQATAAGNALKSAMPPTTSQTHPPHTNTISSSSSNNNNNNNTTHHPPHHSDVAPTLNIDPAVAAGSASDTEQPADNATAGRTKRASRKPKSPATKERDRQRAKERAKELEREREANRIGGGGDGTGYDLSADELDVDATSTTATTITTGDVTACAVGVGVTKPADLRLCPLPALAWAEAADVWRLMCRKDEKALLHRRADMLARHPGIQARMRAILLDWLMEVCEVYKLHRETYYLAVDYLDRYLTVNIRLAKTRLQLIGITCLFVAAKVEEIYPPKIAEFAYVTDGACTEDDIVKQEMLLMLSLNWSINPVTIMGWLSVYMQLNCSNRTPASFNKLVNSESLKAAENAGAAFVYPQFSALEFVVAARILDLCTLDVEMAHFQYSVVAAAVLALTINRTTALRVSGLDWLLVKPCVKWMEPFYEVVMAESAQFFLNEQEEQIKQSYGLRHICADITTDDSHIIQTHTTSMKLFEAAIKIREAKLALAIRSNKKLAAAESKKKQQSTPAAQTTSALLAHGSLSPGGPLTPPDSNRKFNDGRLLTASALAAAPPLPPASANGGGNVAAVAVDADSR